MKAGRTPVTRDAVQRAIEQAGAEGITGESLATTLGMSTGRVHATVNHLRTLGILPIASRRFCGLPSRYWASADLMPPTLGTVTQRISAWLAGNPHGGTADAVAKDLGIRNNVASSLLSKIAADGHAVSRPVPQGKAVRRRHYYATEHQALMPAQPAARPAKAKPARLASLAPADFADVPVDYSRAVVTVCPAGRDHRFTFTPPHSDWRGAITRDWQERRLQEQQHG